MERGGGIKISYRDNYVFLAGELINERSMPSNNFGKAVIFIETVSQLLAHFMLRPAIPGPAVFLNTFVFIFARKKTYFDLNRYIERGSLLFCKKNTKGNA